MEKEKLINDLLEIIDAERENIKSSIVINIYLGSDD